MDRWTRLIKKGWLFLAILMILVAIIFSVFRALTPWASQYKADVEQHLSLLLGQPVTIDSMETSWYWLEPVLKLNQVTVLNPTLDPTDHVLKLAKLMVGINLFSSLWHWQLEPGILYIDDLHLTLHQLDNRWQIDGLRQDKQITTLDADGYLPILTWLLSQQKIVIKHVSALLYLKNGSLLPLSDLTVTAVNHQGHYRLKGNAKLSQTIATELSILADMYLDPYALPKVKGHAYVSIRRFLPTQWESLFPKLPYHLDGGDANVDSWIDLSEGKLTSVQTQFDLHHVVWNKSGDAQRQFIQTLQANVAWAPTTDGWKLSGDHIQLNAGGIDWPENAFLLEHQKSQQHYDLFIKSILLKPLAALTIQWPDFVQPLLAKHPIGELHDLQIGIKNDQIDQFLSGFTHLGWQAWDNFPTVSHLSGALSWQPEEGRLDLDGVNTTLITKGLPPVVFSQVNAAFEWKTISDGLRISMEHLVLDHPDFVVSARGVLDEALSPDDRNLRLTAEYSAEKAERWLAYIPSGYLKPKLDAWLKHNIKHIDKISGQMVVDGVLAKFPFDNQPGEFSVVSQLTGTDLWFDTDWPIINDIDLDLVVKKRDMDIDLIRASFSGTEVTKVNLQINDIGQGKETLILHGKADITAPDLRSYLLKTPLRHRLKKLKQTQITGPLQLDLSLEAPLYPENDDILARGSLLFSNNQATLKHKPNPIKLTHLSGLLKFDEHGATDSELTSRLFGEPVNMTLKAVQQPTSSTELKVVGNTTIDSLHERLDWPVFDVMDGDLSVIGTFTLPHDSKKAETLLIEAQLKQVNIDLPSPFGKAAGIAAPLTMRLDLRADKATHLHANYDDRLSGDLRFNNQGQLAKGVVHVGKGEMGSFPKSGLAVIGSLPTFDVNEWRDLRSKFTEHASDTSLFDHLQLVDLKLGEVTLWGKKYSKLALNANKIDDQTWSVRLNQQNIAADFNYQHTSNMLSGHISRLFLEHSMIADAQNTTGSPLKPLDIPNLNLSIDALKMGSMEVGQVKIKSNSTDKLWHMESGEIKSPGYQINMKGDWTQQEGKNNTSLQTNTHIDDLETCLKKWDVIPAVGSRNGDIRMDLSWSGAINDVSLKKINGTMSFEFKKGQITHLSHETEEKLGLGKLLSILSLQTIPRRLQLDFSDLSNKGYSFDTLKGSFIIKNGVMSTSDSYIDGPVAYASMKGDLDVAKQLYDVHLHISPHVTASLPIVATIAGGPIAGMAAWVASKIINQGMQQVTGYTYKISGPWFNPVVQQVSIYKKVTP